MPKRSRGIASAADHEANDHVVDHLAVGLERPLHEELPVWEEGQSCRIWVPSGHHPSESSTAHGNRLRGGPRPHTLAADRLTFAAGPLGGPAPARRRRGCPSPRREQCPSRQLCVLRPSGPLADGSWARSTRASARVLRKSVDSLIVTASCARFSASSIATLPCNDLRPHSSPDDLREEVVLGGELLADLRERRGVLVAPLRVEHLGEMRSRGRAEGPVAHFLERKVSGTEAPFGRVEIAGQELDDPVDIQSRGV